MKRALLAFLFLLVVPFSFAKADTILSNQNDHSSVSSGNFVMGGNPHFNVQFFNWVTTDPISIVVIRPVSLPQGYYTLEIGGVPFATHTFYDGASPLLAFYADSTTTANAIIGSSCPDNSPLSNCYFVLRHDGSGTFAATTTFAGTIAVNPKDAEGRFIYNAVGTPQASPLTALWYAVYTGTGFGSITPFTLGSTTTAFGVTASSTANFCGSITATSTSILGSIANDFSYGICYSFSFLFVPDEQSVQQFSQLSPALQQKFPFSWVSQIASTWQQLQASSTTNAPVYSLNLHDLGIGSTTAIGNILPNFGVLSTTTIQGYFPAGAYDAYMNLARIAIVLTLVGDIFFSARNLLT